MRRDREPRRSLLPAVTAVLLLVLISVFSLLLLRQSDAAREETAGMWYFLILAVMAAAIALVITIVQRDRQHSRQLGLYRVMSESGVFTALADDELTLLYANDKFFQLYGLPGENINTAQSYRCARCIYPDDLAVLRAAISAARDGGGGEIRENVRITTAGGGRRWLLLSGAVTLEKRRALLRGVVVDITPLKEAEQELQVQQQITQLALKDSATSIWILDHATHGILPAGVPGRLSELPQMIENVPDSMLESGAVLPESRDAFREMHDRLFAGAEKADGVFHMASGRGDLRWFHIYYINLFDENGKPYRAVGRSEDVTVQQETLQAFQRELGYRRIMEQRGRSTLLFNVTQDRQVLLQGDQAAAGEFAGCHTLGDFYRWAAERTVDGRDVRRYFLSAAAESAEARRSRAPREVAYEFQLRGGAGLSWVRYEEHQLNDPDTGDRMAFLYLTDITGQKRREAALEAAARSDQMTGLLNHAATFQEIRRFLQTEGRAENHVLFMLDVDNFKSLNDGLGHQYGDRLLADVAGGLRSAFRDTDILGRVGGDEFMVLMKNCPTEGLARRKAGELVASLQRSCRSGDAELPFSVSVGLTICRQGDKRFDELYAEADAALYRAKNSGKNRWRLHSRDGDPAEGTQSEEDIP